MTKICVENGNKLRKKLCFKQNLFNAFIKNIIGVPTYNNMHLYRVKRKFLSLGRQKC